MRILLATDLYLPSFNELFPMAILEASNLHLPILVRDLPLYEDILFGHVLTADDVASFAEALTSLAGNSENYDFWSRETVKIENYYSADHVSKLWIDFYRRIAGKVATSLEQ